VSQLDDAARSIQAFWIGFRRRPSGEFWRAHGTRRKAPLTVSKRAQNLLENLLSNTFSAGSCANMKLSDSDLAVEPAAIEILTPAMNPVISAKGRLQNHSETATQIAAFTNQIGEIIVGKAEPVRLAVACLLARGHLLIEDIPGVGKTTLAHALARSLGLAFQRIQFTSDLLPADILGNSIFDREERRFVFHRGPLFSQIVLIDEVNRATAKTQSALLEAMEEGHISIDGVTHELPKPFFVIATQNPQHQVGTFPLPESQLDRFLMRIELGVPDRACERAMLLGMDRREMLKQLQPVFDPEVLVSIQTAARKVHTSSALLDYLQDLLDASRQRHSSGLSPRAGLALLHASQAWALMNGRDMVLPEDVQAVGIAVMAHRLGHDIQQPGQSGRTLAHNLLSTVPVP
jgi:MoxR-like ATPase